MKTDITKLEERTRAILAVNPNYRPHYYVPPHEVMDLITALREAVGVVEKVTSMVDDSTGSDCMFCHKNHPGHSRDLHDAGCFYELADQTLRSIAEKVEGL